MTKENRQVSILTPNSINNKLFNTPEIATSQNAMDYAADKITVIPILRGEKSPRGLYSYRHLFGIELHALEKSRYEQRYERIFEYQDIGIAAIGGRGSDGLFAIDADNNEQARMIAANLHARNLPTVAVQGNRDGGLKFLFKSAHGTVKGERVNSKLEIKGDTQLIVLPPSIHPSGKPYRWVDSLTGLPCDAPDYIATIDPDEIDFLTTDKNESYQIRTIGSGGHIDDETRDFLRHGHHYRQGIRNEKTYHAARVYHNVGKPIEDAWIDIAPIGISSGLSEQEVTKTIRSAYSSEKSGVQGDTEPNDTRILETFIMDGYDYSNSRTRTSELSVLLAMVKQRAIVTHHYDTPGAFDISARQLAEAARLTHKTALNTIHRLLNRSDIQAIGKRPNGTVIYRFSSQFINRARVHWNNSRKSTPHNGTFSSPLGRWCSLARFLDSPLAEAQSIGKGATLTLRLLQQTDTPLTVADIASVTGVTQSTARRRIARLIKYNLVQRAGWQIRAVATDSTQEHRLAIQTGAFRAENRRKNRHALDRALFALKPIERALEAHARRGNVTRIADYQPMRL